MKISYGAVVPLPPDEAFAFVSEADHMADVLRVHAVR